MLGGRKRLNYSQDETSEMQGTSFTPELSVSELTEYIDYTKYTDDLASVNGSLTAEEIDTLGEVGNICMGAAATAMYRLLDHRVVITAPRVAVLPIDEMLARFPVPIVLVEVEYVEGITGRNMLLLEDSDAALITDILMGGEGVVEEPELTELHMSAMNEIMNQMIGSSATVLSQVVGLVVNISTPMSYHMRLADDITKLGNSDRVIVITFDMEIDSLLSSRLVQIMPYDVGRTLSETLTKNVMQNLTPPVPVPKPAPDFSSVRTTPPYVPPIKPPRPALSGFDRPVLPVPGDLVDVRPLHFQSFDENDKAAEASPSGIDSIFNIPLTVAAELGTTTKNLNEVLNFQPGVVFMLEKSAGDPVEILVNGKRIARGEVVIIDNNYGVRITELPEN